MTLPSISVKRPVTVYMLSFLLVLLGLLSIFFLPVELMPGGTQNTISIITRVRGGISPQEVEELITKRIEEAVGGVSHLKSIRSISREGESIVILDFKYGANMDIAAMEVREKYAVIRKDLPGEVERPVIAHYDYYSKTEMIVSITSRDISTERIRALAEDKIKKEILNVEGVANVEIYGGKERKILVEICKDKINALKMPIIEIMRSLGLNNLDMMAGSIEKDERRIFIRTTSEFESVEEMAQIPVTRKKDGTIIKLRDVAKVTDSFLEPVSYARVDYIPGISLYIHKKSDANTLNVAGYLTAVVEKCEAEYIDLKFEIVYNKAEYILKAINSVRVSLFLGAVLVSIVLFLFIRRLRIVFVILVTLPIAVISTFFIIKVLGLSINIMTLSGLALGIGMLVDSAIVIIESIFSGRRFVLSSGKIAERTEKVMLAVIASTFTTIIVFLPLVYLNEKLRASYVPVALTICSSLIIALFISLSLIPVLVYSRCKHDEKGSRRNLKWFRWLKKRYIRLLCLSMRNQRKTLGLTALIFFISAAFLFSRGLELTSFDENEFTIRITPPAGAKLDAVDVIAEDLEKMLKVSPAIKTVSTNVTKTDPRIVVKLYPLNMRKSSKEDIIDMVRAHAEKYGDFFVYFEGGAEEQKSKELVVDVYGYNDKIVSDIGREIAAGLASTGKFKDVKVTNKQSQNEYNIIVDKARAALYEFSVSEIAEIVHSKVRGMRASKYHDEGKEIEIITRLDRKFVRNIEDIKNIILVNRYGDRVYLKQVASFIPVKGPVTVYHKDRYRTFQVSADIGKMDLRTAAQIAENVIGPIQFPRDYFYKFGGGYEDLIRGRNQLFFALILSLLLIYMVLAPMFRSYIQPFIIMLTVPLGVIGVSATLFVWRMNISNGVIMGMIMLVGIMVNNSILLVHHINLLLKEGRKITDGVLNASAERLRPILMTTVTTVFGLIPMVIGINETSALWRSMALTVIGGLTVSALLTLIVIPNLYFIYTYYFRKEGL